MMRDLGKKKKPPEKIGGLQNGTSPYKSQGGSFPIPRSLHVLVNILRIVDGLLKKS